MEDNEVSPFRRLRQVLAPERADIWVILIYVAAVGVLALIVPVATQALVNTAAFGTAEGDAPHSFVLTRTLFPE